MPHPCFLEDFCRWTLMKSSRRTAPQLPLFVVLLSLLIIERGPTGSGALTAAIVKPLGSVLSLICIILTSLFPPRVRGSDNDTKGSELQSVSGGCAKCKRTRRRCCSHCIVSVSSDAALCCQENPLSSSILALRHTFPIPIFVWLIMVFVLHLYYVGVIICQRATVLIWWYSGNSIVQWANPVKSYYLHYLQHSFFRCLSSFMNLE